MDGSLWSCGWNEHGNLGRVVVDGRIGNEMGSYETAYDWVPVMRRKKQSKGGVGSAVSHVTTSVNLSTTTINATTTETVTTTNVMTSDYDHITNESFQRNYDQVRLQVVWEGALSCGGGHCLCLTCDNDDDDEHSYNRPN